MMNSFSVFVAILSAYTVSASLVCNGPHEVLSKYSPLCPENCDNRDMMRCMGMVEKESCQCEQGYIKLSATNNTCVKSDACPTKGLVCTGAHEVHSDVTPLCPRNCVTPKLHCLGLIHKESCLCEDGYVWKTASDHTCVKEEECEAIKKEIIDEENLLCDGVNEYKSKITPVCPTTCDTLHQAHCMALLQKPSCQCGNGTVRDTKTNKCVKAEECTRTYSQESIVCKAPNEVYKEWVSACPAKCPTAVQPYSTQTCMAIIHKPSCVCTNGTIKDTVNNRCVKAEECPPIEQ